MRLRTHQEALQELVLESAAETFTRPNHNRAVIIFTPRSGSSWLADLLSSTKLIGFPNEYANQSLFHDVRTSARTEVDYLNFVELKNWTQNGWFSMEITYGDIERFETLDFFAYYREATFVHLRRKDIVAQAVSCHLATRTGIYHKVGDQVLGTAAPVEVDREQIPDDPNLMASLRSWCGHIANYECLTEIQFYTRGITPLRIYYEDICADPDATVAAVLQHAGISENAESASAFRPVSSTLNAKMRARFIREQREFVKTIKRLRPPLSV